MIVKRHNKILTLIALSVAVVTHPVYTSYADETNVRVDVNEVEELESVGLLRLEEGLESNYRKSQEIIIDKVIQLHTPVYIQSKIDSTVQKADNENIFTGKMTQSSEKFYNFYKKHCDALTEETATLENLDAAYRQAGYLWETEKLDMFTFKQILCMLEYSYKEYGVIKDKNEYLKEYQNNYYQYAWDSGVYDEYIASMWGYGSLGNPYGYKTTPNGDMVLATAYAVADSWTKGTSGEVLRYSQTSTSIYNSVISDKVFRVRPDCTGYCYTILKELGCTVIDSESLYEGFYSGSMVRMCRTGEMESDPNLKVLPFNVEDLEPGDIMVAAASDRLTRWGTTEPFYESHGHAEIFVGFPDENDHSMIDVWNWGSKENVNRNFPLDAEYFVPQRKHHPYNYTYIIRYIGGTRH